MHIVLEQQALVEEQFGAAISVPLVKLLGIFGTMILCIGIAVLLIVFMFKINMSEIIQNAIERSQENRQERYERRQQEMEERMQNRQMYEEEEKIAREKLKMYKPNEKVYIDIGS